jgi:tRNA1(Val) A37 N6-methylase TrmN6
VYIGKTLNLYQHEIGYRYNSDSLLLYDFVSQFHPKGNLLDIGSGCGIVGLLLKRDFPHIALTQIEIQKSHYEMNIQSAQQNGIDTSVIHDDFLTYHFEQKFDFIVSNPPFYDKGSKKSENESLDISRYAQNLPIENFFKRVSSIIKPRGSFIFCYDAKQIDRVISVLLANKFKVENLQFIHTKKDNIANLMLVHVRKSSKSLTKVMPPIVMHNKDGIINENVKKIYEKSKTKSYAWKN